MAGGGGMSSSISFKLLAFAVVSFAISMQFKASFRTTLRNTAHHSIYDDNYDTMSQPPGARRWERGSEDWGIKSDNTVDVDRLRLRGDGGGKEGTSADDRPTVAVEHESEDENVPPVPTDENSNNDDRDIKTSPSLRFPRMISIQYIIDKKAEKKSLNYARAARWAANQYTNIKVSPLKISYEESNDDFEENSVPSNPPKITPDWYSPNADEFIDGYDWSVCEPMYDWQLKSYPSCNNVQELDLSTMRVINTGGSRIAFEMKQQLDGRETKFVYKSIKYHKDLNAKLAEEQRRDSTVLERTTSSKFIPDIHGYCSVAVIMDFMPEGNMHDYIKGARLAGGSTLPPVDRLKLSIHIATSVADLHTIDNTPMPSIFHNDICCHQYLFQDGIFKLNDFNYARAIYVNKETNEQCTRKSFGIAMWKARSLEEHQIHAGGRGFLDFKPVKPDKVDVWMMGNLIYYMLTDLYTFEKPKNLSWEESGRELMAGRRSPYPEHIKNSKDPSHVAIKKALEMTWTQNPNERPSARIISDYLIGQLKEITREDDPDLRVVLPERDPNQGSSESDYNKYND